MMLLRLALPPEGRLRLLELGAEPGARGVLSTHAAAAKLCSISTTTSSGTGRPIRALARVGRPSLVLVALCTRADIAPSPLHTCSAACSTGVLRLAQRCRLRLLPAAACPGSWCARFRAGLQAPPAPPAVTLVHSGPSWLPRAPMSSEATTRESPSSTSSMPPCSVCRTRFAAT